MKKLLYPAVNTLRKLQRGPISQKGCALAMKAEGLSRQTCDRTGVADCSHKWPQVTSENGSLFAWPRKPHKIMFTLRTLVKLPGPSRLHISEKPPRIWRMSLYRSSVSHCTVTTEEWVGVPRPNRGGWTQGQGPKTVLIFLLHTLKNAASYAVLEGLDVNWAHHQR